MMTLLVNGEACNYAATRTQIHTCAHARSCPRSSIVPPASQVDRRPPLKECAHKIVLPATSQRLVSNGKSAPERKRSLDHRYTPGPGSGSPEKRRHREESGH